jgi:Bacterial membrane protein YfhO
MHERGLAKELLATNYNAAYKIESLLGHDGLMLQRLHAEFDGAIPPWGDVKPEVLEQQKFRSLLNLYGVRYLLVKSSEAALLSKYYQLLYSGDEVSLFENGQARPRLFPITAPQEIEAATAPSFVGEERGWGSPLEPPSPPATVELRSYDDAHLGADVTFGRDGILVHGTNYVSGWHAKIDEVPTPVFRVAGSLQGISVPQGQHHVEFWYAPESVKWGAIVSAVAGGLVVLLCLWPRGQKTQDFSSKGVL